MVFTIGSMREIRQHRTGGARHRAVRDTKPARARRNARPRCAPLSRSTPGCAAGPWCPERARRRAGGGACSCGADDCKEPGAHPLPFANEIPAGTRLEEAADAWSQVPGAAVLLPVGRSFDVIDVAEASGHPGAWSGWSGWDCGSALWLLTPHRPRPVLRRAGRRRRTAASALPDGLGTTRSWTCGAWAPATTSPLPRPTSAGTARSAGCASRCSTRSRSPLKARLLLGTLAYVCHREPRPTRRRDARGGTRMYAQASGR